MKFKNDKCIFSKLKISEVKLIHKKKSWYVSFSNSFYDITIHLVNTDAINNFKW
jgi:hypothetical protein